MIVDVDGEQQGQGQNGHINVRLMPFKRSSSFSSLLILLFALC